MNKNDFRFEKEIHGNFGVYPACINGIEVSIPESIFNDEKIASVYTIVEIYPSKLHLPILRVEPSGGILTYCNHELDDEHLLDLEFGGTLETFFSISIDG